MSWSKPRILLLNALQISDFLMAQNSGEHQKKHSFPESAFTFGFLNRTEKRREELGEGWGEKSRSLSLILILAMTHRCIPSFSTWESTCFQGSKAVRAGFAQVDV